MIYSQRKPCGLKMRKFYHPNNFVKTEFDRIYLLGVIFALKLANKVHKIKAIKEEEGEERSWIASCPFSKIMALNISLSFFLMLSIFVFMFIKFFHNCQGIIFFNREIMLFFIA